MPETASTIGPMRLNDRQGLRSFLRLARSFSSHWSPATKSKFSRASSRHLPEPCWLSRCHFWIRRKRSFSSSGERSAEAVAYSIGHLPHDCQGHRGFGRCGVTAKANDELLNVLVAGLFGDESGSRI